jgi:hypothetical protein
VLPTANHSGSSIPPRFSEQSLTPSLDRSPKQPLLAADSISLSNTVIYLILCNPSILIFYPQLALHLLLMKGELIFFRLGQ